MKKIFSLLVILMIFIIGCGKEEPEAPLSPQVIKEIKVEEEVKDMIEEEEEEIVTVRLCHDTDKGMVRWVKGTVFGFYNNAERFELEDYCFDNNILVEYYCDEGEIPQNMTFVCKSGCAEGHCQ